MESIIGAGILGGLKYNDQELSWAVELGQNLDALVKVNSVAESIEDGAIAVSKWSRHTIAIDRSLRRHGIPIVMSNVISSSDDDIEHAVEMLLNVLLSLKGQTVCALAITGQCTAALSALGDDDDVESVVQTHLDNIERRCSDLSISLEAFGSLLIHSSKSSYKAGGVRRLLIQMSKPLSVLMISADPRDAPRLRLGEERRELEDAITRSRFRDSFILHDMPSCRVRDITSALDKHCPTILHFSGHGENSELFFEDDKGNAVAVDKIALANLLGYQENLKIVILNACYSRDQAQAIADAVGYVVAMEGPISDSHAIEFSREFYAALGHGRTFKDAFTRARSAMGLMTTLKPHLLIRTPSGITLSSAPGQLNRMQKALVVKDTESDSSEGPRSRMSTSKHHRPPAQLCMCLSEEILILSIRPLILYSGASPEYVKLERRDTASSSVTRRSNGLDIDSLCELGNTFTFSSFSPQELILIQDLVRFLKFAIPVAKAAHTLPLYSSISEGRRGRRKLRALVDDLLLLFDAEDLDSLAQQAVNTESALAGEKKKFKALTRQCTQVVDSLTPLLGAIETDIKNLKIGAEPQCMLLTWKEANLDQTEQRLKSIQNILHRYLQNTSLAETSNYLNQLHDDHLRFRTSRVHEVDHLKKYFKRSCLNLASAVQERDSESFSAAIVKLPRVMERVTKLSFERTILSKLFFLSMENRHYAIAKEHASTFRWIFVSQSPEKQRCKPTNFVEWLEHGDNLFWITGKPGSGKSTLMKFLAAHDDVMLHLQQSEWLGASELVLATFFFWSSAKDPLQKSQAGLLRSILYHILQKCPELIPVAFPEGDIRVDETWSSLRDTQFYDVANLLQVVQKLSQTEAKHHKKFFLIIDGLDEYAGSSVDVIRLITALQECSSIKLLVSSRPWNEFEAKFGMGKWNLAVDQLTTEDIRNYVKDHLAADPVFQAVQKHDKRYADLVGKIVASAEGVFLWVFLVIRSLLEGLTNADTIGDLQKRLADIPTDLEDYFEKILLTIQGRYQQQMADTFIVTLESVMTLPVLSYWFFDQISDEPDSVFSVNTQELSEDEASQRMAQMAKRLNARCKGLLEMKQTADPEETISIAVFTSYVDFLHRTARDFLGLASMQQRLKNWASQSYDADYNICGSIVTIAKSAPSLEVAGDARSQLMWAFFYHIEQLQEQGTKSESVTNLVLELEQTIWTRDVKNYDLWVNKSEHELYTNQASHRLAQNFQLDLGFMVRCTTAGLVGYVSHHLDREPELVNVVGPDLLIFALTPKDRFGRGYSKFIGDPTEWGTEKVAVVEALLSRGVKPDQEHHMKVDNQFPHNSNTLVAQHYFSNMIERGKILAPEIRLASPSPFLCCKMLFQSGYDPCDQIPVRNNTKKGFSMVRLYAALRPVFTNQQYLSLAAEFRPVNQQDAKFMRTFMVREGLDITPDHFSKTPSIFTTPSSNTRLDSDQTIHESLNLRTHGSSTSDIAWASDTLRVNDNPARALKRTPSGSSLSDMDIAVTRSPSPRTQPARDPLSGNVDTPQKSSRVGSMIKYKMRQMLSR